MPTLNLTEHDISPQFDQFVYVITASEPLLYPISLRITILATVFEAGKLVGVLHKLDVTFKRGSYAWYGFYAEKFLPDHPSSGIVLFDRDHGKLECARVRSSYHTDSFRSREPRVVTGITVNISHPSGDDNGCLGSDAYHIGASEITITLGQRALDLLFPGSRS